MRPECAARGCSLATLQQGLIRAAEVAHGDGEVHVALHAEQVVPVVLPHVVIVVHDHHRSIHCRQALSGMCIVRGCNVHEKAWHCMAANLLKGRQAVINMTVVLELAHACTDESACKTVHLCMLAAVQAEQQ